VIAETDREDDGEQQRKQQERQVVARAAVDE
jgi:hypothetical protein